MTCDSGTLSDNNEYIDILNEISALLNNSDSEYVIVAGDFNTDFSRGIFFSNSLNMFMSQKTMTCVSSYLYATVDYTFVSKANGGKSNIDYVFVSHNLLHLISNFGVNHDGDSLSDHSVINVTFSLPNEISYVAISNVKCGESVCWNKARYKHIENYKVTLDQRLDEIDIPWDALHCKDVFCTAHVRELNDFYDKIINGYIIAGKECIPSTSHVKKQASVPGWSMFVEDKRKSCILWHKIWKETGSPSSGVLYELRRHTRSQYH